MANVRYVPKRAGFRRLFNSEAMCEYCTDVADGIAANANGMFDADGYMVSPGRPGKNRCHAIVYTGDTHTVNSNIVHNTLLKALG